MKSVVFLFIVGIFLFTGCSKDEEVVTPSGPTNVASYEGLSDQSKTCSVTIGDIGGKSYVIGYSVSYSYSVLGGTATETHSKSNTDGIAELAITILRLLWLRTHQKEQSPEQEATDLLQEILTLR